MMMGLNRRFLLMLWMPCAMLTSGQTTVDLRTQSKNVDFSSAASTKPFQAGTAVPSTCTTGQMFFLTTAPAGSNLYGCAATNSWSLESGGSGSGGSGGATVASQLGDFLVTQVNSTTLSIGSGCTAATRCNVGFGGQTYSFSSGGVVNVSGGTGTAYVYISSGGVLTVGHNLTANCSTGCTAQAGVTAFPLNSIPLFTWTATNGTWDATGGSDQRAFLSSTQTLTSGAGIQLTQTPGESTVAIDSTVVGLRVAAPATSSSACVAGTWAADTSYYYVCVTANAWLRAPISTF
jgi:hypothetical protein